MKITEAYIAELKKLQREFAEHKDPKQLNRDFRSLVDATIDFELNDGEPVDELIETSEIEDVVGKE